MIENPNEQTGMLSPYRVLDLTDERGEIAGMVLGDLGADVIKIEPPGGSSARRCEPLLADGPEAERSLQFAAFNRNKRSIVLDLSAGADRDTFIELVRSADFLIESVPGSLLDQCGLDFDELKTICPRLIQVQVSAFGTSGPAADWPASDLTIAALGGPVALQGVIERPPIRLSVPQVWRHTGTEAAVAALVAHERMLKTGEAQLVDVSAQCAMTWTLLNSMDAAAIQGHDFERKGSKAQTGQITLPIIFECADGHIVGPPTKNMLASITDWLIEDKIVDESWRDRDWEQYEMNLMAGSAAEDIAAYSQLCLNHRKKELMERGLKLGVTFAPVNTLKDMLEFDHLDDRDYWIDRELPNGVSVRTPGMFVQTTTAQPSVRHPVPSLDQHGEEIRAELEQLRQIAPEIKLSPGENLPFEGLKVADFSWVGVGPITARCLADHGATVVHVESELRPDVLRGGPPFKDGEPGWNRSQFFADFNTSKLGMLLNLKDESAVEIARELIGWADVYIESFSPGVVGSLGLGYDEIKKINPDIIMISTCLMGQSGPASSMAGFGYHAGAMAGFYEVTGWPDMAPDGPWVAYTDTIAPRFLIATLISAIDHRRRTGEGQYIDAAQFEMGLHYLAPEILDYQVNDHMVSRMGNRSRYVAPHGVYPCKGEEDWCAIAIQTDEQWTSFCAVLGNPTWSEAKQYASVEGRLAAQDEIDDEIARWSRTVEREELATRLRDAGIPAGEVKRSSDLLKDEQYAHRKFYRYYDHPEMGNVPYAGHQFSITGYESGPRFAAPVLGQHSVQVMQDLLGMSDDEIAEAFASGAIA